MELIGEYHRDKVLCLPKKRRKQMDLPRWRDDTEVVNELFGWVIMQGKKLIMECRSENEARYIWALWSFEWTDFWVPKDAQYLEEILPRLLVLHQAHHEFIQKRISFYSRRKIREELKWRIYRAATLREKEDEEETVEFSVSEQESIEE